MKKLLLLLMSLCLYACVSIGFAAEYPQENYEMYYAGNRSYPIAFVQWGNGYVLDGYSLRHKGIDSNELTVDIHEVDLATNRMKPNPMHVYAKYDQELASFVIGFMDSPDGKPEQLLSFDESYLNKGTSETALLFPAGRALWEMYTGTPLYKQYPMLKPIGESGAPCMINVNENTRYARIGYDLAEVIMEKASGLESYTITFKPDYFIINSIYAENPQVEARLRREELNKAMFYEDNPRVRLVANYMGIYSEAKKAAAEPVSKAESGVAPRMEMLDGPGMANVNQWKHQVLDGTWHAPEGTLELNFRGFDFDFGIYKAGEPDNFRWTQSRFYFDGAQNSQDKNVRYDLLLSDEPCIKDANGNVMVTLLEMWHEKISIYVKLQYPDAKEPVIKELRRMQHIRE